MMLSATSRRFRQPSMAAFSIYRCASVSLMLSRDIHRSFARLTSLVFSLETAGILAQSPKSRAHGQKLWQGSLKLYRISQEDSGGSTDRAQILESVPRGCNHYSSGADHPRLHADGVETPPEQLVQRRGAGNTGFPL